MRMWDGRADVDSVGTALYLDWLLQDRANAGLAAAATQGTAWSADQTASAVRTLAAAGAKLRGDFSSVRVAWGTVLRMARGATQTPCGGFGYMGGVSAAVRPTSGTVQPGGWIRANFGSSTRMIVSLEPKGIRSWSVLPYGNSDDPVSPHYTDQMGLYGAGKYKVDSFGADAVAKSAKESLRLAR
jgi:acyl-homoserine-lactone acylase